MERAQFSEQTEADRVRLRITVRSTAAEPFRHMLAY